MSYTEFLQACGDHLIDVGIASKNEKTQQALRLLDMVDQGLLNSKQVVLMMVDQGLLDPKQVVLRCVKYMSEDEVADMLDPNELSARFDDDE